uniref:Uncharacterized protein n=1 Tax=Entomoneis paludosa TaxID=265537 RepID=A0A7S2YCW8_9STRA|mmetsp:Transcript_27484/g.57542  ORF Transcript_27484/g.57542 Transcript_27484/m.57542 type:complete len:203 (+) Transcript_27484:99-707(+)
MKNRQNQPTLTKDARALHSNCLCERILARPGFVFCVLLLLLTIVLPPTVTMIQSAPFQRSSSVSNANIKDAPKIRVRGPEDEQAQENTALTSNPSKRLGQRVGIGTAKEATKNDGHCQGKAELLNIVKLANGRPRMPNLESYCSKMPSWQQVSDLYGETPVFVGLETCPRAHTMEFLQSHRSNESIRVAGLYNTGKFYLEPY